MPTAAAPAATQADVGSEAAWAAAPTSAPAPAPGSVNAVGAAAAPVPAGELGANDELIGVLLAIVAEKTGYPADMLDPSMELEADLGIDSIKRVEILAALRGEVAGLPELDNASLGRLRTLEQISDRLCATAAPSVVAPPPAAPPAPPTRAATATPSIPAAAPASGGLASASSADPRTALAAARPGRRLTRLVTHAVATLPSGLALPGLGLGRLVVTDDGAGVAPLLVKALASRGIAAEVVVEVPADATGVVFLGALRHTGSALDSVAVHREALRAARAVAARFAAEPGVFVTVQDTGGDFGQGGRAGSRAWLGGVAALTRTVAKEWPRVSAKAIDCERGQRGPAAVARLIAGELLTGAAAPEVGLRADGTRLTPRSVCSGHGDVLDAGDEVGAGRASVARAPAGIGPDSLIVATGGARGITAASLVALARRYRPKIVLLGRSPMDEREPAAAWPWAAGDAATLRQSVIEQARAAGQHLTPAEITRLVTRRLAAREVRSTVAELERSGSAVRYVRVDVRDAPAVSAALSEVRRDWGPVTGIVHGAGVLADARVADKTDEDFERVFGTKVLGLEALLQATADDPLTLLCAYSSVSARFGNAGQSDYAMANEVLGQVLAARQADHPGCLVRAIAWGAWQGGMVTTALERHFTEQGIELIPVPEGSEAFLTELTMDGPAQVVVAAGAPAALADRGDGRSDAERRESTAEVLLTADTHRQLMDHAITGVPVLPMALAVEWFAGMAAISRDGSGPLGGVGGDGGTREGGSWDSPAGQDSQDAAPVVLRDVAVLRTVALPGLPDGGERLVVRVRPADEDDAGAATHSARLERTDGVAHYHADLALAARPSLASGSTAWSAPAGWEVPPGLEPLSRVRVYDGDVLFHGPLFQAIRTVRGVGTAGAAATLVGLRELGWDGEVWWTDPAAVDGGLQLAVLWAAHVLGTASLPMAVAELRLHRYGPVVGEITCVVRAGAVGDDTADCDVALIDADGRVRAELIGVSLVRRPG